jgi:hypothetical protein
MGDGSPKAVPLLPPPAAVGDMIGTLVGKRAHAKAAPPLAPAAVRGVATYVETDGTLAFVALIDLPFLVSVGGALAMVPAATVNDAIRKGVASEALVENATEAMNVTASLFSDVEGTTVQVRLGRFAAGPLDASLAARLVRPAARVDLEVAIPGYPDGRVSFVALARPAPPPAA